MSASPTERLLALLHADPDRFTKDLYATLFALAPETRAMFPANMAEQRQVLFDTLELLLTGLGTEDEQDLIAFLAQLGRDHRRYGVTSAHYQAFTKALVWTIRDRVGPRPLIIPGAVLGGFLMGVAESLVTWLGYSGYKDAAAFVILIVVLIFKPGGLLGSAAVEKV